MPQNIPDRTELNGLIAGIHGPVTDLSSARSYLESKRWILSSKRYDRTKLVDILLTASVSLKIPADAAAAIRAVAYLLEDDITDKVSSTLASAVADKVRAQLADITTDLSSNAKFINANATQQAATSVKLKEIAAQYAAASVNLADASSKLSSIGPKESLSPVQWPALGSPTRAPALPSSPPSMYNPDASAQHTDLQRRLLAAACTVFVEVDPPMTPLQRTVPQKPISSSERRSTSTCRN